MNDRRSRPPPPRDNYRAPRPPAPSRPRSSDGERLYGLHAALAAMKARPNAIMQVMHAPAMRPVLERLLAPLEAKGVSVRVLSVDTLDRMCESTHHEGVVLLVRPTPPLGVDAVAETLIRSKGFALALDRVRNPHNVGAILRSAAFFGIDVVLLESPEGQRVLTPAAVRVAEGGAEHVVTARCTSLEEALGKLKRKGVGIVGTDRSATQRLFDAPLRGPCVLVMGNEREGLSDAIRAQCDSLVSIAGTDRVDSLNVSVAAGILLAAAAHARRAPESRAR